MKPSEEQRREILGLDGNFGWNFHTTWFVETSIGNFIWSDPEYGGDNSFTQTELNFRQFNKERRIYRDKGNHNISSYCGDAINITLLG